MVRITLKQCRYALAVADQGGIAQAARALNISQPAVAQALDKLEAQCGLRLFLRHHARGTEVTPQGRSFLRSARRLLEEAERAEGDARAIAADLAGKIRFACFHTLAPFHAARIIADHRAAYPGVEILATELLQEEIIAGIEAADLDLALTYDLSLEGRPLARREVARLAPVVLLAADHPYGRRRSIRLADLAQEPFVMFEGPASRNYFERLLGAHKIAPPVAYSAKTMESVRCAVARGLGFSLSVMRPRHQETYDGGRVVSVPIADDVDAISVVLVRHKDKPPSNLIENLMATCLACVS